MNIEQMLECGYFKTESGYRKKISNKRGVKFYVNYWEIEDVFVTRLIDRNRNYFTVEVSPLCFGYDIFRVEKFINEIWDNMNCQYIEKFKSKEGKWRQKTLLEQIEEEKNAQK